jgi:hypothetical protein
MLNIQPRAFISQSIFPSTQSHQCVTAAYRRPERLPCTLLPICDPCADHVPPWPPSTFRMISSTMYCGETEATQIRGKQHGIAWKMGFLGMFHGCVSNFKLPALRGRGARFRRRIGNVSPRCSGERLRAVAGCGIMHAVIGGCMCGLPGRVKAVHTSARNGSEEAWHNAEFGKMSNARAGENLH